MKDFDEQDSVQRGGGGATGIFAVAKQDVPGEGFAARAEAETTVTQVRMSAPVPASVPVPATPPPTPAAGGSAGGFTQLLRTLTLQEPLTERASPEIAKASSPPAEPVFPAEPRFAPSVAAEPAPAPKAAARSFTQMFETMKAEVASRPSPATPTQAPMAATPVQSAAPVAPGASGFTQLFQALDTLPPAAASSQPEARREAAVHAAPGVRSGGGTEVSGAGSAAATPQPNPETFTQMFQTLDSDTAPKHDPPSSAVPAAVAAPVAASLPIAPAQQPSYAGGGITQLLRAIDLGSLRENAPPAPAPMTAAAPVPPAFASAAVAPAVPSAATVAPMAAFASPAAAEMPSGTSLTGMFKTAGAAGSEPLPSLSTASVATPEPATPSSIAPVGAAPSSSAPSAGAGSFTQMFKAMEDRGSQPFGEPDAFAPNAAVHQPPAPAQAPASFTQFFSSAGKQTAREASQADAFPPIAPTDSGRLEYGSASASSSAYGEQAPKPWDEPRFSAPPAERPMFPSASYAEPQQRGDPPPASSGSGNIGSGGLTQLLQTLDSPPAGGGRASQPRMESGFTPPPVSAPYPKVDLPSPSQSGATTAFRLPQIPAAAAPANVPAAGPGEFTRIIQASAMRESARQGGGGVGGSAASAPVPAPASGGGSGFSVSSSGMPMMPSAPVMPSMPMMSGGGGGGGGSFSTPQMPIMPSMPSVPNLTGTAAPAAGAGGGSKLLPILLILVIVLLVAVLLAVVLLMKH